MFSCLQQAEERNFLTSFSQNLGFVDLPNPVCIEHLIMVDFELPSKMVSNMIIILCCLMQQSNANAAANGNGRTPCSLHN